MSDQFQPGPPESEESPDGTSSQQPSGDSDPVTPGTKFPAEEFDDAAHERVWQGSDQVLEHLRLGLDPDEQSRGGEADGLESPEATDPSTKETTDEDTVASDGVPEWVQKLGRWTVIPFFLGWGMFLLDAVVTVSVLEAISPIDLIVSGGAVLLGLAVLAYLSTGPNKP